MPDGTRPELGYNFDIIYHASLHRHICLYSSCFCNRLQTILAVV